MKFRLFVILLSFFILPNTLFSAQAGTWSAAHTLQGVFATSSPPEAPLLAINDSGHTISAWAPTGTVRYADRLKGGVWSSSAAVPQGITSGFLAVAIGNDETSAIAWATYATRYTPSKLVVTVRQPGGIFPKPTKVAPGTSAFKLGIAGDGTVILIWNEAAGIKVSELPPSGSWSLPALISNAGSGTGLADLVVNNDGAALAVWQQGSPGNPTAIAAAYRVAGGGWELPQVISNKSGLNTWNPKPDIDAAGNVGVGYIDGNDMIVVRKSATGAWGFPVAVSAPLHNVYYPAFAMDAAGNALAAWQSIDLASMRSIWVRSIAADGTLGNLIRLSSKLDDPDWPSVAFASDSSIAVVTWIDNASNKARATVRLNSAGWTRYNLGAGWWGTPVPVVADAGTITAAWPIVVGGNPNAAKLISKTYE